jgi:predicted ABC-type transport system involved in lysophospholipase L1 biosynthesis ATPase subunit
MSEGRTMDPIIQAEGIEKTYRVGAAGPLTVLRSVSLAVGAGTTLAITGPSGAGKSTLLHVVGGLDQPTSGRVIFKGRDLYRLSSRERTTIRAREIGFVFQSYHLLPELDVLENVLLPTMTQWPVQGDSSQRTKRAEELLDAVGLSARLRHTPLELSGGEQQRVALARALINEPDLVLADEPTGNLDTGTGEQVLNCLFALTKERHHTLILVTHNTDVAARCDQLVHLRDGRVDAPAAESANHRDA